MADWVHLPLSFKPLNYHLGGLHCVENKTTLCTTILFEILL